eukprot:4662630-Pleurochrysis_carterae.AAC.1
MALQKLLEAGALAPISKTLGVSRERSPLLGRAARRQTPQRLLKLLKGVLQPSAQQHGLVPDRVALTFRRVAPTFR